MSRIHSYYISSVSHYFSIFTSYRAATPAKSIPNRPAPKAVEPWTIAAPADDVEAEEAEDAVAEPVREDELLEDPDDDDEDVPELRLAEEVTLPVATADPFPLLLVVPVADAVPDVAVTVVAVAEPEPAVAVAL